MKAGKVLIHVPVRQLVRRVRWLVLVGAEKRTDDESNDEMKVLKVVPRTSTVPRTVLYFKISTRSQTDTKVTTDGLPVKQQ